jgi:hypothetical protein
VRSRFVLAFVGLAVAACSSTSGPAGGVSTAPCTLPPGPYGTNVGDVVDPNLSWTGYVNDSGQTTTVHVRDYFDCDGTRGVRVLVIDESALWCPTCQSQAQTLAMLTPGKWKSEGAELLVLMAQDQQQNQASVDTALTWRNEFTLTTGAVVADPAWTTKLWGGATGAGNGFPTDIVIDPRTLRIVAFQPTDLAGTVDNLAIANR